MIKTIKEKIQYPIYKTKRYMFCDKCGELMLREPIILTTMPPQYRYYCPVCGHTETSFEIYNNTIKDKVR